MALPKGGIYNKKTGTYFVGGQGYSTPTNPNVPQNPLTKAIEENKKKKRSGGGGGGSSSQPSVPTPTEIVLPQQIEPLMVSTPQGVITEQQYFQQAQAQETQRQQQVQAKQKQQQFIQQFKARQQPTPFQVQPKPTEPYLEKRQIDSFRPQGSRQNIPIRQIYYVNPQTGEERIATQEEQREYQSKTNVLQARIAPKGFVEKTTRFIETNPITSRIAQPSQIIDDALRQMNPRGAERIIQVGKFLSGPEGLQDIGGEFNVLQMTMPIPSQSIKAGVLSRETALFKRAKTITAGKRVEEGTKGIDVILSSKVTSPSKFDKYIFKIKPTKYSSKITQPYYQVGENKILFEGGQGMASSQQGKNVNFALLETGGRFQIQNTIPRIVSTKNDLSISKAIGSYEGGIGRSYVKILGGAKGKSTVRFNALTGGRESLFTGKRFYGGGKKFYNLYGVGKEIQEGKGLSVFGGEAKGVRFNVGKLTAYGKIEEAGYIERVSIGGEKSEFFSTGGGTQKTSLKSLSGYQQGLGKVSMKSVISVSNTKPLTPSVISLTQMKTPQVSTQQVKVSLSIPKEKVKEISLKQNYYPSEATKMKQVDLVTPSEKQRPSTRTRQIDLSQNRFKELEVSQSRTQQLEQQKPLLRESQMLKQQQLQKQIQITKPIQRTSTVPFKFIKIPRSKIGYFPKFKMAKQPRTSFGKVSLLIKQKGIWKSQGKYSDINKATSAGKFLTGSTINRSFKIEGGAGKLPTGYRYQIKKGKPIKNVFVELSKTSISQKGEREALLSGMYYKGVQGKR